MNKIICYICRNVLLSFFGLLIIVSLLPKPALSQPMVIAQSDTPAIPHLLITSSSDTNTGETPATSPAKAGIFNPSSGKGSSTATYTAGIIDTDLGFQSMGQSSTCPGLLSINIPANATITSVDVAYAMTAKSYWFFFVGNMSQQRSQLRCTSPGGISEMQVFSGTGNTTGTQYYSRTGLNIANGVTGGGNIQFQLHTGRTALFSGCNRDVNLVDNGSWTITVYYTIDAVPDFTAAPMVANVNQPIIYTSTTTGDVTSWSWNFGAGATPASATTQGPHTVSYTTPGNKTISLTVNGSIVNTKAGYVTIIDPPVVATATYSAGNIPTDDAFQTLPGSSTCPEQLTVTIPAGAIITAVDVEYAITAQNNGWMSEQRSQLRCVSSGGTAEAAITSGTGNTEGTQNYSRTGLTIANGVTGGGNIVFELHAGRTWSTNNSRKGCKTYNNFVNNNTWKIRVYYQLIPTPQFYATPLNPSVGQTVIFTDNSTGNINSRSWNFGAGAIPATASTVGPHTVIYNSPGPKTVSLTLNNLYTNTKPDYIYVTNPNDWLKWDDNVNATGIGRTTTGILQIAVKFLPADYNSSLNRQITRLRIYVRDLPGSSVLKIWQGTTNANITEYVSQSFTPIANSWNEIVLSQPYVIDNTKDLWVGAEYYQSAGIYPGGVDAQTSQDGKSNLYRVDPNNPNGWFTLSSASINGDWNLQAYLVTTGSWTGLISSAWENANNWFTFTVPTTGTDVDIPVTPHNPVISTTSVIRNLSIQSGASLTIAPNSTLTVSQTITNNAGTSGLVIASTAAGTGSLIHNTAGVAATFQRFVPGESEAWHILSSPMTNQPISGSFTPPGSYADGTGYDFYTWYEPDTSWVYLLNDSYPPTWITANGNNNFLQGRGYMVEYEQQYPTLLFSGTLATGDVSVPITKTIGVGDLFGSNQLGNPYPSSIDWKAATGWNRTSLQQTAGGYSVWIWNDTAYNYGVYNSASIGDMGTLGVSRYIAPTQGFFVQAVQSGNISMNNSVRVHNNASEWLKSTAQRPDQFFFTVSSLDGFGEDEILIGLDKHDESSGSYKRFSFVKTAPALWVPDKGRFYSTLLFDSTVDHPVIPVSFRAGASGNYRITSWFEKEMMQMAILIDKKTGQRIDLLNTDEYLFQASPKDDAGRFVLQLQEGFFPDPHQPLPVRIFAYKGILTIDLRLIEEQCRVTVYDPLGNQVFGRDFEGGNLTEIPLTGRHGIFIARVRNDHGEAVNKIIL
jgi:PKD repeat protein